MKGLVSPKVESVRSSERRLVDVKWSDFGLPPYICTYLEGGEQSGGSRSKAHKAFERAAMGQPIMFAASAIWDYVAYKVFSKKRNRKRLKPSIRVDTDADPFESYRHGPCHLWTRYISAAGYPLTTVEYDGYTYLLDVSRALWIGKNGPVPKGCSLKPKCGNMSCVRMSHYILVTYADDESVEGIPVDPNNPPQKRRRGRPPGSRTKTPTKKRYSPEDLDYMIELREAGESYVKISAKLKESRNVVLSPQTIGYVVAKEYARKGKEAPVPDNRKKYSKKDIKYILKLRKSGLTYPEISKKIAKTRGTKISHQAVGDLVRRYSSPK